MPESGVYLRRVVGVGAGRKGMVVNIPHDFVEKLGLKKGDYMKIMLDWKERRLFLEKMETLSNAKNN